MYWLVYMPHLLKNALVRLELLLVFNQYCLEVQQAIPLYFLFAVGYGNLTSEIKRA